MNASLPLLAIVVAGLWPFGNDDAASPDSVGSIAADSMEAAVEDIPVAGDAARAREHYARFLESGTAVDPGMRAVATRRLADLTLEEAENLNADSPADPRIEVLMREAANLYRRFLAEFPSHEDTAIVRYQLARALDMAGETGPSLAVLDELVVDEPGAVLGAEAQFRRGEVLFSARRWREAEQAYAAVLEQPEGAFHEQARYKLGWTLFKQGLHEESLVYFFDVVDGRLVSGGEVLAPADLGRAQRELVDDSLRAVSIGFSYLEGADSVEALLAARPSSARYAALVFDRLGVLYLEQERYQDAAQVFSTYVENNPLADDAPAMQVRVIAAYDQGGFGEHVLQAKRDFAIRFGIANGYWDGRGEGDLPAARSMLRSTLDELAEHYHTVAREDASAEAQVEAASWYRVWLETFPADPEAARKQFLLAELLFDGADYRAAAQAYTRAAYGYDEHQDAPAAGQGAILAWKEVATLSSSDEAGDQVISASLKFADRFPGHPEAPGARVEASRLLFDSGRFEPALANARIATGDASVSPALRASALRIAGHSAFELADYAGAETAYADLLASGEESGERDALIERLAASVYRQGETASAAGDYSEAIRHFSRVADVAPDSAIATTADYDAAMLAMQSGQWADAANMMRTFRSRYPGHEFQDQVTISLATALTEAGDMTGAATELVAVSSLESQDTDVRRAALWEAAGLYDREGAVDEAVATWTRYVADYPAPLDPAMEARRLLADASRTRGDESGRLRWLRASIEADASAAARTTRSRTIAAHASLEIAEGKWGTFSALRLTAPIEKSLALKKAGMEAALDAYGRCADYDISAVITQATYRMADIYREFANALMTSERPPELDAAALEEYEILLEEQAFPFEEKSIEIHAANAARARDGLYDEWVVRSFEALADLHPARYARNELGETLVHRLY